MATQSLPSNPGFVRWEDYLPWLFHKPPQPPMQKGRPQEVESTRPSVVRNPAEEIRKAAGEGEMIDKIGNVVEAIVNNTLGKIFSKEHIRDGAVYTGAAVLLIVAFYATVK